MNISNISGINQIQDGNFRRLTTTTYFNNLEWYVQQILKFNNCFFTLLINLKFRINDLNEDAGDESDSTPATNDRNLQINNEPININYNVTIRSTDSKSSKSK